MDTEELWSGKAFLSTDWKKFSLPFSGLTKVGTIGNGTLESGKIIKVSYVLVAYPAGSFAESYLDYATFTFGKPFSQR